MTPSAVGERQMLPMQTNRTGVIAAGDPRRGARPLGHRLRGEPRAGRQRGLAVAGPDAEEAGRERVAGAGGVDDLVDRDRAARSRSRSRRSSTRRRAPRLTTNSARRGGRRRARRARPRWGAAGRSGRARCRNAGSSASGAADAGSTLICMPGLARAVDRRQRRAARARAHERVAGDVQDRALGEHVVGQLVGRQRVVRARVGEHRALAAGRDEHDARAGRQLGVDARRAGRRRPSRCSASSARVVVADARDQRHVDARARQPGGDVRARAAGAQRDPRGRVAGERERPVVRTRRRRHRRRRGRRPRHSAPRSPRPARRCAGRGGRSRAGLSPPVCGVEALEQERRHVAARDAAPPRPPQALAQHAVVQLGVDLLVERVGDDDARRARRPRAARAAPRPPPRASPPATVTGSPDDVR